MTTSRFVLVNWFIFHLVLSALVVGIIFATIAMTRQSENVLQQANYDAFKVALQRVEDHASVLAQTNARTRNIAKALAFDHEGKRFLNIADEVGPRLFTAFAMLPSVAEISYIGSHGSVLSYYRRDGDGDDDAYMLFSETSNSSDPSAPYKWYRGLVNESTGDLYDNSVSLVQQRCNYSKWLQYAADGDDGGRRRASWGVGCGNVNDSMILYTAPVAKLGAILLVGVGVKGLADKILKPNLSDAYMYLGTDAGHFVGQTGPPHTRFVVGNDTISIRVTSHDDTSLVHEFADYSCRVDDLKSFRANRVLEIRGENYKFGCGSFGSSGLRLMVVLAFRCERFTSALYELRVAIASLIGLLILGIILGTYFLLQFLRRSQAEQSLLQANLVKQKEATQQAERKSMNKTLTFASASHDIRTSLAGITGLIELCHSSAAAESELQSNLKQMDICAKKLLGILNSILDFSKVEAGKMQLEELEFDMAQVLEESIDLFHVVAMKKGLEVIWDPCDCSILKSCKMIGDSTRFKQIIDNLLGNAIKFTFEGHVVVRAWAKRTKLENVEHASLDKFHFPHKFGPLVSCFSKEEDECISFPVPSSGHRDSNFIELTFEVEDSGIGIPVEKRASVFENYVQVKDPLNEGQVGTGLGLGIVQSYVRLMGGEISIQDKEFAKRGTCFRFNITLRSSGDFPDGMEGDMSPSVKISGADSLDPKQSVTLQAMTFRKCPRFEGTQTILYVQGSETNKMLKTWFQSLGIIVSAVDRLELLCSTLERIRDEFDISTKFESSPVASLFNRSRSHSPSKERVDQHCSFGDDAIVHCTSRKANSRSNSKSLTCILIVVDLSYGRSAEIDDILKKFARTMLDVQCKIVWLIGPDTPSADLKRLKQRSSSVMLQKPCHGSRLCTILRFLQDSGGGSEGHEMQTMDIEHVHHHQGQPSNKLENLLKLGSEQAVENCRIRCDKDDAMPLSGISILLVEDTPVLRLVTAKRLCKLGASVATATNGLEALNLVRKALQEGRENSKPFPYDVVLMDCEMPIMDGYEATRHIREEEKMCGLHIPVIALTAHSSAENGKDIVASGMDFHLTKPPDDDSLLRAIRSSCQMAEQTTSSC